MCILLEDSQLKDKTIDEISKEIDSSISATQDDTTLLRGLIKLLQNIVRFIIA